MNKILKKSLLGTAFLSVTLLAGCREDKPAPAPAPQQTRHYYTKEEATKMATEAYDKKGMNVSRGDCYLDTKDSWGSNFCDLPMEAKVDDGIHYTLRFSPAENSGVIQACALRDDNKIATALDAAAEKAFNTSAPAKFSRLGFSVFEPLEEPAVTYGPFTGDTCGQTTSATFLLKQDGMLYTADYSQEYSYGDHSGGKGSVENLAPASRKAQAAAAKKAAATNDDTDTGTVPQRKDSAPKPEESKMCYGSCIGPHLDLQTGKIKMYGNGPGYKF